MLSDTDKTLYAQLTEISFQIENALNSGDISAIGILAETHNTIMEQIKRIGIIDDTEMVTIIQKAEESVRKTMAAIQQKQIEIMQQLKAEKNKQLLSSSYST